jgi:hypothetical protein
MTGRLTLHVIQYSPQTLTQSAYPQINVPDILCVTPLHIKCKRRGRAAGQYGWQA